MSMYFLGIIRTERQVVEKRFLRLADALRIENNMKKKIEKQEGRDELRREDDLSKLKGGVRGICRAISSRNESRTLLTRRG